MRKLILAAIGFTAWRWLNAPAREDGAGSREKLREPVRRDRLPVAAEADKPEGDVTYRVVEHDGGWAYKVGDVFSETFPDHNAALEAARIAAREHTLSDEPVPIEYQDASGKWRREDSDGRDRPHTAVEDTP